MPVCVQILVNTRAAKVRTEESEPDALLIVTRLARAVEACITSVQAFM